MNLCEVHQKTQRLATRMYRKRNRERKKESADVKKTKRMCDAAASPVVGNHDAVVTPGSSTTVPETRAADKLFEVKQAAEKIREQYTTDSSNALNYLRKYGLCLVKGLSLDSTNAKLLPAKVFEDSIFEYFDTRPTERGVEVSTNAGEGKRMQSIGSHSDAILEWSNIKSQLEGFFNVVNTSFAFFTYPSPLTYSLTTKQVWPNVHVVFEATRLHSAPKAPVQAVHCDNATEGDYNGAYLFPVDVMIPISAAEDTYLDIRPVNSNQNHRIMLRRGEFLVWRGDVAHRGVENKSDKHHYRIHLYVDYQKIRKKNPSMIHLKRAGNNTRYVHVPFS